MNAEALITALEQQASPKDACQLSSFFKTGPGEYGQGDIFIGVRVPKIRAIVKQAADTPLETAVALLRSELHEARLLALLLMVTRFENGDPQTQKQTFDTYLAHAAFINNWDLVDLSAPNIVGSHLRNRPRGPLYALAKSKTLWERRIAIVATFALIRNNDFVATLKIARALLNDKQDLIHKATGWMLREVGKRDQTTLETFLRNYLPKMPRTTLRYAIERFDEPRRQAYLKNDFTAIRPKD